MQSADVPISVIARAIAERSLCKFPNRKIYSGRSPNFPLTRQRVLTVHVTLFAVQSPPVDNLYFICNLLSRLHHIIEMAKSSADNVYL